jgi:hypothetical protein
VPGVDIIAIVKSGVEESQLGQPRQGVLGAGFVVAERETPRHARLVAPDDQIKVVGPEPPVPRRIVDLADFEDSGELDRREGAVRSALRSANCYLVAFLTCS